MNFDNPAFVGIIICWILSVGVHEFAHALAAYAGGDRSDLTKQYLKFNIFDYVHPVTTFLVPALWLALGGIPLPGGAVYLNTQVLSKEWQSIVSFAGPLSNFILFLILALVIHPSLGLVDLYAPNPPVWVLVVSAMVVLELFSVLINLVPIPPLDGFGIIEPWMTHESRQQARAMGWFPVIIFFLVIMRLDFVSSRFFSTMANLISAVGLPVDVIFKNFNVAMGFD